ncbi:AAA domain protein [uncultured archaeon]|nr:AAA domain protein [uncultured archaeon]
MRAIIMMHGLPGTGKSFIAEKIAASLPNTIILKTARFRENLKKSLPERFDENNPQTRKEKDKTYKKIINEARKAIKNGKTPILDATFHKKYRRKWAYNLAKQTKAKLIIISTKCNEHTIFQRLKKRKTTSPDAFLKTKTAYQIMKKQADALREKGLIVNYVDTARYDVREVVRCVKGRTRKA